jgi:hypothetical protein
MNTTEALSKLFDPNDTLYICGALRPEGGYYSPTISRLSELDSRLSSDHVQFCLNPLHPVINRNPKTNGSRRCSENVVKYKTFLLESDTLPVELQKELVPKLSEVLPIRLAVYSGGKSVHYFINTVDTLNLGAPGSDAAHELYKHTWNGIHLFASSIVATIIGDKELAKLQIRKDEIFDNSTKDPARLARLPMATRNNGVLQSVVFQGPAILSDTLAGYSANMKLSELGPTTAPDPSMTVEVFERRLWGKSSLNWLRSRFENPETWANSSNMYFEVFKLALWAIDSTGVPYHTLNTYLQKKVYPVIVSKGYPRDPSLGVVNAYNYKGLL